MANHISEWEKWETLRGSKRWKLPTEYNDYNSYPSTVSTSAVDHARQVLAEKEERIKKLEEQLKALQKDNAQVREELATVTAELAEEREKQKTERGQKTQGLKEWLTIDNDV